MTENSAPAAQADRSIDEALAYCIAHAEGDGITLRETLERLGPASFCFVCLLLCVPFLQPMSLGPLTMASGITFLLCGWQMARGQKTPVLPRAMRDTRLHGKVWVGILKVCQRTLKLCRKFCRPRLQGWVTGKTGEIIVGWMILTGGFLFAIPMANLPFNNTFPALMVLFAAIAWLERDGAMLVVSLFWCAVTLVYFAVVGATAWLLCSQAFAWLKHVFFP